MSETAIRRLIAGAGIVGLLLSSCTGDAISSPTTGSTEAVNQTIATSAGAEPVTTLSQDPSSTPGVSPQTVVFGQSAAFSGPAQELGKGMRVGIRAAFAEMNARGGVHGRSLELVSLDDTYEPELAIANTVELIETQGVFALIGEVGTPTSRSVTPVAAEAGVPFIAPFTGAAFLRDEHWTNIINMRASYAQETEEMVARMTTDLGITRIAIMYQDDSFGRTGYQGALAALERRNMKPVAIGLYPRNTTAVKTGLIDIQQGNPEGVIIIGAYRPVSAFIAWARFTGFDPIFITISFVGSNALASELGEYGTGVYVTQVVPFPTDDSIPVVAEYLQALAAYDAEAIPGFVSLEGYLAGRLAIAGLEMCGVELDHECFLDSILANDTFVDLDGFPLRYSEGNNQGSNQVYLTRIAENGVYEPTDTLRRE